MGDDPEIVVGQILRHYRHLMSEVERRADRAFLFGEQLQATSDPASRARMTSAIQGALADPSAAALFGKGRQQFLRDLAERIVSEHGHRLPRCAQCGRLLRKPSPKDCFDCDFAWPAIDPQS